MKKLLAALFILLAPVAAHAQASKTQIISDINADFADNTSGAITAALLRAVTTEIVSSYVDWLTCSGSGGTLYYASGTPTCLAAGIDGQYLRTNSNSTYWSSIASAITAGSGLAITGTVTPTIAISNASLNGLQVVNSTGILGISAVGVPNTFVSRSITGTANEVLFTNGDGVSGNPTASLPAAITLTGKNITGGTFASTTLNSPTVATPTINGASSGTGVASANTPSTLVFRDSAGDFQTHNITLTSINQVKMISPAITATISVQGGSTLEYSEGVWNPTLVGSGSGNWVLSTSVGSFEKIGRQVTARFTLVAASSSSPVGQLRIGNLPYAANGTANDQGKCEILYIQTWTAQAGYTWPTAVVSVGNTFVNVFEGGTTKVMTPTAVGELNSTPTIIGYCNYRT